MSTSLVTLTLICSNDTNPKYQEFYNLVTANGFLPLILQPTRITDSTMTLIDNIYTNNFSNDIYGGNLLLEIAYLWRMTLHIKRNLITIKETIQNGMINTSWMIWQFTVRKMNFKT